VRPNIIKKTIVKPKDNNTKNWDISVTLIKNRDLFCLEMINKPVQTPNEMKLIISAVTEILVAKKRKSFISFI